MDNFRVLGQNFTISDFSICQTAETEVLIGTGVRIRQWIRSFAEEEEKDEDVRNVSITKITKILFFC